MTLDEKREVIETLLCLGDCCAPGLSMITGTHTEEAWRLHRLASDAVGAVQDEDWTGPVPIEPAANEAAYRLIESSAVLRREWFARSGDE